MSYIKQHSKFLVLLILFSAIFCISFMLYHLPVASVLYPSLLCIFLSVVFLIIESNKAEKKHIELLQISKLSASMINSLPEIKNGDDEDYQRIILNLIDEQAKLETETANSYTNMIDYYTVWAHQIKTPIAVMKLNLQDEDSPLSRRLSSELFRIEQYVQMVLVFLRLDSNSTDYVIKEYDLDNIIKQTVKRFAGEFIARKISLKYNPINVKMKTDEKWFSFVLEQIISNALKYTREGSVKIYVENNDTLCIEDSGIGIAGEDLPRIFEKGFTGYNGRSDKKASGLGLYLCKRICKNLNHNIYATSEVDKGTVIHINLKQYELNAE